MSLNDIRYPNGSNATIFKDVLTTNGIPDPTYDREKWLIASGQVGKRHPLDPLGVCMSCGDHKIGKWEWKAWEPD